MMMTVAGVAGAWGSLWRTRTWPSRSAVPFRGPLDAWRGWPGGREWLTRLPEIVDACAEAWELQVGEPYNGGKVGLALRVERADRSPAVLKVSFPQRGAAHEAEALALWQGVGAVRLLERDDARHALLVERCEP